MFFRTDHIKKCDYAQNFCVEADHLGNVLATVLDRKTGFPSTGGGGLYDYWLADLASTADYYPGGMMMPGRNTEHDWSRMGYNGQAKDEEVYGKGNLNTALFWEMDTRIIRRWNLDPKPQIGISDYATFKLNPIMMNDPNGDVFKVANNKNSKDDVRSIVMKPTNQQYVKIDENDGTVSTDFKDVKSSDIKGLLRKDKGLALINRLHTAKEKYFYEVSNEDKYQLRDNSGIIRNETISISDLQDELGPLRAMSNFSVTPRNIDGGAGGPSVMPIPDIDGYVRLSSGVFGINVIIKDENGKIISSKSLVQPRASLIYHELNENWYRTTKKQPYMRLDGTGAHQNSVNDEGESYGKYPGKMSTFTPEK